jgi:phosphate transport system substrate-binding protein
MGYSPLPPNLSQEVVNSIGRMNGTGAPKRLTAANCSNPRFHGSLGSGSQSPPNPLENVPDQTGQGDGDGGGNGGRRATVKAAGAMTAGAATPRPPPPSPAPPPRPSAAPGRGATAGPTRWAAAPGDWRDAEPTSYDGEKPDPLGKGPMVILLGLLATPPIFGTLCAADAPAAGQ